MSAEDFEKLIEDTKKEIVKFNNAIDSIVKKKLSSGVKKAFDELQNRWTYKFKDEKDKDIDRWLEDDFKPTSDIVEHINSIRFAKSIINTSLKEQLDTFYSICESYYLKSEEHFYVFQIEQLNSKKSLKLTPLKSSVFKDLYEKAIGSKLPQQSSDFEKIHKKYKCASFYEKFDKKGKASGYFTPQKPHKYNALSTFATDAEQFGKSELSGEWKNFKEMFQSLFKD